LNTNGKKLLDKHTWLVMSLAALLCVAAYLNYSIGGSSLGSDLAVNSGTPVHAAMSGVVEVAGWDTGYGNYIILKHANGMETVYGHNSKLLVKVGQSVKQGDTISLSGSTGYSTGPHVHFEVRVDGHCINPLWLLPNGSVV